MCAENKAAAKELMRNYDEKVVGKVMAEIFALHSETDTCYTLTEAETAYENITDKYNGQFNFKVQHS